MPFVIIAIVMFVVWASKSVAEDVVAMARGEQSPRERHRAARAAARAARTGEPGHRPAATGRPLRDYLSDLWADSWENANTLRADRAADQRAIYEKARDDGLSAREAARVAGYGLWARLRGLLDYAGAEPDDNEREEPGLDILQPEPDLELAEPRTACPTCGGTLTLEPPAGWLHPDGTNICPDTGTPYPVPSRPAPDNETQRQPSEPEPQQDQALPEVSDELLREARVVLDDAGYVSTALLQRTLQIPYDVASALVAHLNREHSAPQPDPNSERTTTMADELNYEGTLAAHAILLEQNQRISDALAVIDDAVRTMSTAAEIIGASASTFKLPAECLAGANAVTDGFNADEVHRLMDLTDGAQTGISASQDYLITEFGDAAEVMARTGADGAFVNAG